MTRESHRESGWLEVPDDENAEIESMRGSQLLDWHKASQSSDEEKSSLVGQPCRRDGGGQSRIPTPASDRNAWWTTLQVRQQSGLFSHWAGEPEAYRSRVQFRG